MNIIFPKKKKNFPIIKYLIFIIGMIGIYKIVGIFVITDNTTTRLAFHDFYNQENIDVAIVGTSRAFMGFNPYTADEETGIHTFNLGTSSQTLDASYYEIKEAVKRYNIERIYLEVEFDILTREIGGQQNTWIISDYMKGINKYAFIFDVCKPSEWPLMLFRVYRYKDRISPEYCLTNLKAKNTPSYWKYENRSEYYDNYEYYLYNGFAYGEKVNDGYDFFAYEDSYGEFDVVSPEYYNSQMLEYLRKSIMFCENRDIELVLFTMPESKLYIEQSGRYNLFTQFMNQTAEEYNISYYDFNLLADDRFTDDEFINLDHLTQEGASHFSKIWSDIYKDPFSHSFYNSIEDESWEGIKGIIYHLDEDVKGKYRYTWHVVDTKKETYKYKIYGYSTDRDLIYESEILDEESVIFETYPEIIVMEVFDYEGNYIGNAKFL